MFLRILLTVRFYSLYRQLDWNQTADTNTVDIQYRNGHRSCTGTGTVRLQLFPHWEQTVSWNLQVSTFYSFVQPCLPYLQDFWCSSAVVSQDKDTEAERQRGRAATRNCTDAGQPDSSPIWTKTSYQVAHYEFRGTLNTCGAKVTAAA